MRRILTVLALVTLAAGLAAGGWWWHARRAPAGGPVVADTTPTGVRAATLWFADAGGDSLVPESRERVERESLHERVSDLVAALDQGPSRRGLATLPPGTSVLHVYLDDRGLLVLDLSRAFQQGFHGGSRAEELAIGSLVRTLASNVPEVQHVLVTCGGAPLASLGGHVPLDRPLDVHDW